MSSRVGGEGELQELAVRRANIYGLLAALYIRPPDRSLLARMAELIDGGDREAGPLPGSIEAALETIQAFARRVSRGDPEGALTRLGAEFTRLFRGIGGDGCRPPYESVYREGVVFGLYGSRVQGWYRRFGLGPAQGFEGEPPDHIAFELEFMRILCEREAEAHGAGDRQAAHRFLMAQGEFLDEHLLGWVGDLCREVRERDETGFYRGVAELTEGWLRLDRQLIDELEALLEPEGGGEGP